MMTKKTAIILGLLLTLLFVVVAYAIVVPRFATSQYREDLRMAVRPLTSTFRALDKSTELPLLIDSGAPGKAKNDNAIYIQRLIQDSRKQLTSLDAERQSFSRLPFSDLLGQYAEADALNERTKRLLGQSEDALDDYETLVHYLVTYNNVVDDVVSELRGFNEVVDINSYSGQSNAVSQVADKIRMNAASLAKITPPGGMKTMNTDTVAAMRQAADGFDELGYGLAIPADDPIYVAARKIETATTDLERLSGDTYDYNLSQSPAIKNMSDLSDKLDLVSSQ